MRKYRVVYNDIEEEYYVQAKSKLGWLYLCDADDVAILKFIKDDFLLKPYFYAYIGICLLSIIPIFFYLGTFSILLIVVAAIGLAVLNIEGFFGGIVAIYNGEFVEGTKLSRMKKLERILKNASNRKRNREQKC